MVTKNFMMLVAAILQSNGSTACPGNLPVKATNGTTYYIGSRFGNYSFPVSYEKSVNFSITGVGIHVGSCNTPPTANDYTLEAPIESGLTANTPTYTWGVDENNNPYLDILFTLTNTTENDVIVREVSYVQAVSKTDTKGNNVAINSGGVALLTLDRTVLGTPVTVPVNGSASITYRLKTILPT